MSVRRGWDMNGLVVVCPVMLARGARELSLSDLVVNTPPLSPGSCRTNHHRPERNIITIIGRKGDMVEEKPVAERFGDLDTIVASLANQVSSMAVLIMEVRRALKSSEERIEALELEKESMAVWKQARKFEFQTNNERLANERRALVADIAAMEGNRGQR